VTRTPASETSIMLALDPTPGLDAAERGDIRPVSQIMPLLREQGVRAVSGNGVLGTRRATARGRAAARAPADG